MQRIRITSLKIFGAISQHQDAQHWLVSQNCSSFKLAKVIVWMVVSLLAAPKLIAATISRWPTKFQFMPIFSLPIQQFQVNYYLKTTKLHIFLFLSLNMIVFSILRHLGFYSWRNTTKGSWFMQCLCQELEQNGKKYDILTLLTFVCQRVAVDFESNTPDNPIMHQQKQIPCITTMLTRLLRFHEK